MFNILKRIKLALLLASLTMSGVFAQQQQVPLIDLMPFKTIGNNWSIAGDVSADISKANDLTLTPGKGILVTKPTEKDRVNLVTNFEHGDIDLEIDFLTSKSSNSGIYFQGRYELQILDSWGVLKPKSGDCGGIYERWDESKPNGYKGYLGIAPRVNACKAPGLWQKYRVSFQAPRFKDGNKIQNARINYVYLNDVLIHENLELSGPTRGAMSEKEVEIGPLLIQGDHGTVAFRNIKYTNYSNTKLKFTNVAS